MLITIKNGQEHVQSSCSALQYNKISKIYFSWKFELKANDNWNLMEMYWDLGYVLEYDKIL